MFAGCVPIQDLLPTPPALPPFLTSSPSISQGQLTVAGASELPLDAHGLPPLLCLTLLPAARDHLTRPLFLDSCKALAPWRVVIVVQRELQGPSTPEPLRALAPACPGIPAQAPGLAVRDAFVLNPRHCRF